ncbi:MAG TPA: helix-turn-helix domain-containing protein [Methylocella sp.]|nr:helix-turn-helix domain-containing protein [Methylocella sp.]
MNHHAVKTGVPLSERLAVSLNEGGQIIGIGRTRLYELIKNGELQSVRLGGRRLIKTEALREFIGRLGQ